MSKEERKKKAPKTQKAGLQIIFSSVFMAASLLFDIYAMLNYPDIRLAGVISLVFILAVYFFSSSIIQFQYESAQIKEEMHDELFKSSKATYLMMRKYFDEIQEQLDDMEDKLGIPVDDIMNAQKGIAKITISRNKENADALLNSNDKLLDKVIDFEDKLDAIESKILTAQREVTTDGNQDILLKQQELSNLIKEIEVSLRKEILSLETTVKSMPQSQQVVMAQPMMQQMAVPPVSATQDSSSFVAVESEQTPIPDDKLDEMVSAAAEMMEEATADIQIDSEPMIDPGVMAEAEAMPETDVMAEAEAMPETDVMAEAEVMPETDVMAEAEAMPEADVMAEAEVMPEVEAMAEPEVAVEPEPIVDPNKAMSPDEIAAMLAGMDATAAAEEPVAEPDAVAEPIVEEAVAAPEPVVEEAVAEPVAEAAPTAEEKPPMPDMSDPGHVMTPDEIAALLANI